MQQSTIHQPFIDTPIFTEKYPACERESKRAYSGYNTPAQSALVSTTMIITTQQKQFDGLFYWTSSQFSKRRLK
ncbi:hypothetical protein [Dictyobacter kobayashii]|uniref:Uncharacterized protein n=1 Tax=Dictyobacter kobayashii TaxID=2014872 RepID=A0A402AV41_9CHLR|nr:hypothetical protein [Dictyobacter kobayashii]GCE22988.1 hypothetical protein KDK_67880 [Dictyobacter kobayashii]